MGIRSKIMSPQASTRRPTTLRAIVPIIRMMPTAVRKPRPGTGRPRIFSYMGAKTSSMRLQKIHRSHAVRKTGTVKKKPAMKRDLSQFLSPVTMSNSRIASRATGDGRERGRALVTGGAVRVGRAIAIALARAGMDVAIGYHRSGRAARRAVAELRAAGARAAAVRGDLADAASARRLVGEAARALGGLDVLVNSAALYERAPFAATTPAQYDRLLDLNLRGAFFCSQAAARVMRRRGGHIVNIGDGGAARARPDYIPYALSKGGIATLTPGLAAALRSRGIAVNCVAPGTVLRPASSPRARWMKPTRGREESVADVTAAVVFFATCPRYITGQTLAVDGGENAHR